MQNRICGSGGCSAEDLSVELVNPLEYGQYDQWVAACPNGLPFHSRAWLSVIRGTYGHRPVCFVAKNGGHILALLPFVEVQSWLTGRRGVMVPFADFSPPIARDTVAFRAAFAAAVKFGGERKWKYLELRGGRDLLPEARSSAEFRGHVLDLSIGQAKLFQSFESRARGSIRKAERAGVRTEVSRSAEAIEQYYQMHCETRKKHGLPPQPFRFFQNLFRESIAKGSGVIVTARYQDLPIAAAVFLHQGVQALYKYSASRAAFRSLAGNNLVMWEAVKWYAEHGFSNLHFGRTSIGNAGLRKYKESWGTQESALEYFRYSISRQVFVAGQEQSERAYIRLFGLMPTPVLRLVGKILYPHLA